MARDRKHETTIKSPLQEIGNGVFTISCHYDGEKIGETKFSRGSVEVVVKEGRKIIKKSGKISWKKFYEMMTKD